MLDSKPRRPSWDGDSGMELGTVDNKCVLSQGLRRDEISV